MVTDLLSIEFGTETTAVGRADNAFFAGPENVAVVNAVEQFQCSAAELSPLVLYGPPLSGKTHLARGIASRWLAERPQAKVVMTTAVDYAREFAQACEVNTVDLFAARFRNCDLLILDELEGMAEKYAAQQHFSCTWDALRRRLSACIITARSLPQRLKGLSPRLAGRLLHGLSIPVALPSEATREKLLQLFAGRHGLHLDEESYRLLAKRLPAGTLPLSSTISQLALRENTTITADLVGELVDSQAIDSRSLSLAFIAATAAKLCGVTLKNLKSQSRRTLHVRARGLAMLAARQLTDCSFSRVGQYFGGRDHTTVMNACDKARQRIAEDQAYSSLWDELLAVCSEHQCSLAAPSPAQDRPVENLPIGCQ